MMGDTRVHNPVAGQVRFIPPARCRRSGNLGRPMMEDAELNREGRILRGGV